MASFSSVVTDYGAQVLTRLLADGESLTLFRAAAGSGVPGDETPSTLGGLLQPLEVDCVLQDTRFIPGSPSVTQVTLQVSNEDVFVPVPVRELGVWGRDDEGAEFLFAYSWLEGEDLDNVLPPTRGENGAADTLHLHELYIAVSNQQQGDIKVEVGSGAFLTQSAMEAWAAPVRHTHAAEQVLESTGESVEEAQRRQDFAILALQEQLNTGFTGTTAVLDFSPAQISAWTGFDGTGLPEGVWDGAQLVL